MLDKTKGILQSNQNVQRSYFYFSPPRDRVIGMASLSIYIRQFRQLEILSSASLLDLLSSKVVSSEVALANHACRLGRRLQRRRSAG
jgi:hypothetical protein